MNILYLSPYTSLLDFLQTDEDKVFQTADPLLGRTDTITAVGTLAMNAQTLLDQVDFIVSYGYRFKVPASVTDRFKGRAINLHISYLPWNRGADPNIWSFLEDTPKGVTIHYMDGNIDTGDVIAQRPLDWDETDTLRTTHQKLRQTVESLFKEYWPKIRKEETTSVPQVTYHRVRDKDKYSHLLTNGWDTPVKDLIGMAKEV